MRGQSGHLVNDTGPYCGHDGREVALELDISRRVAFPRFVAGEEEEEVPRTKDRTPISLRLIHTYGVGDPAGLRRPELGATGVERREEQPFGVWWCIRFKEKEGGAALRQGNNLLCPWGCPLLIYL